MAQQDLLGAQSPTTDSTKPKKPALKFVYPTEIKADPIPAKQPGATVTDDLLANEQEPQQPAIQRPTLKFELPAQEQVIEPVRPSLVEQVRDAQAAKGVDVAALPLRARVQREMQAAGVQVPKAQAQPVRTVRRRLPSSSLPQLTAPGAEQASNNGEFVAPRPTATPDVSRSIGAPLQTKSVVLPKETPKTGEALLQGFSQAFAKENPWAKPEHVREVLANLYDLKDFAPETFQRGWYPQTGRYEIPVTVMPELADAVKAYQTGGLTAARAVAQAAEAQRQQQRAELGQVADRQITAQQLGAKDAPGGGVVGGLKAAGLGGLGAGIDTVAGLAGLPQQAASLLQGKQYNPADEPEWLQNLRELGAYTGGAANAEVSGAKPFNWRDPSTYSNAVRRYAGTAGSTLPFFAGGVATGGGKATLAAIAAMGAGSQSAEGFQDALQHGASPEQIRDSSLLNALLGTTEAAGGEADAIAHGLHGKWSGLRELGREVRGEAAQEALQEGGSQFGGNVIAADMVGYDPNRNRFEGVPESAIVGAGLGGMTAGGMGAAKLLVERLPGRGSQPVTPAEVEQATQILQQAGVDPEHLVQMPEKLQADALNALQSQMRFASQRQQLQAQLAKDQNLAQQGQARRMLGHVPTVFEQQAMVRVAEAEAINAQLDEREQLNNDQLAQIAAKLKFESQRKAAEAAAKAPTKNPVDSSPKPLQEMNRTADEERAEPIASATQPAAQTTGRAPLRFNLLEGLQREQQRAKQQARQFVPDERMPSAEPEDAKPADLVKEVRKEGGIAADADVGGELRRLGQKESGTTGIYNPNSGLPVDEVRARMKSEGLTQAETVDDFVTELDDAIARRRNRQTKPEDDQWSDDAWNRHAEQWVESREQMDAVDQILRGDKDAARLAERVYRNEATPQETQKLWQKLETAGGEAVANTFFIDLGRTGAGRGRLDATSEARSDSQPSPTDATPGASRRAPSLEGQPSQYQRLVNENKTAVNQLYDSQNLNTPEAQQLVSQLRIYAKEKQIAGIHVARMLDDVRNHQMRQAQEVDRAGVRKVAKPEQLPQQAEMEAPEDWFDASDPNAWPEISRVTTEAERDAMFSRLGPEELDDAIRALETRRNNAIRGTVQLDPVERAQLFDDLASANEERKARVKRKEMPARDKAPTKEEREATKARRIAQNQAAAQRRQEREARSPLTSNVSKLSDAQLTKHLADAQRIENSLADDAAYQGSPRQKQRLAATERWRDALTQRQGAEQAKQIDQAAHEAATSPHNERRQPTEAQKEAGNYKKGHVNIHGLDVTIENPRGSKRSGKDASGKPWEVEMTAHYGYIKRTEGADGEQVDVYIGDRPASDRVFVIDQIDAKTKAFDEHKVILGVGTLAQAQHLYDAHFDDGKGPQRRGAVTEMGVDEFKGWLKNEDNTKPLAYNPPSEVKANVSIQSKQTQIAAASSADEQQSESRRHRDNEQNKYDATNAENGQNGVEASRKRNQSRQEDAARTTEKALGRLDAGTATSSESVQTGVESAPEEQTDAERVRETSGSPTARESSRVPAAESERPATEGNQPDGEVRAEGVRPSNIRRGGLSERPTSGPRTTGREAATDRAGESSTESRSDREREPSNREDAANAGRAEDQQPASANRAPDFVIGDDATITPGGTEAKLKSNLSALRLVHQLRAEGRTPTVDEQHTLAAYTGWGQFPDVFNEYNEGGRKRATVREELKALLGPEGYERARASTLNAHFTAPQITRAMWRMAERLGFKGGRIVEPSVGVGNFFGVMPGVLRESSKLTGVELDPTTAAIAQYLYPSANIQARGFETLKTPDGFFDFAIGNVPFGDYKLNDARYNKHNARIHDYFFLKTVDQVRPGGLIQFITSTGTMDKLDSGIREALAAKADLVAAMRLPGQTFKANAGTDVVTDIIVLRRRADGEEGNGVAWTGTKEVADPAGGKPMTVNEYFADHPEMILGTLDRKGTMYRADAVNVSRTDDFEQRFEKAIVALPQNVWSERQTQTKEFATVPVDRRAREGSTVIDKGQVYRVETGQLVPRKLTPKQMERVHLMQGLRDAGQAVLDAQRDSKGDVEALRRTLKNRWESYTKKHGFLHERGNLTLLSEDADGPLILALEDWNAKTKTGTVAPLAITPAPQNVEPKTAGDAVAQSLFERGKLDLDLMAQRLGQSVEALGKDLVESGLAYHDPDGGWVTAAEYLSGNVRRKLWQAREAAAADAAFASNIKALEKVQPADVDYGDIHVKLGAPWVPHSDVLGFISELTGAGPEAFQLGYLRSSGKWIFDFMSGAAGNRAQSSEAARTLFATKRASFRQVMESALSDVSIRVMDVSSDGKTQTYNVEESAAANQKVKEIRDRFAEWVWEDDARRVRLHRYYNDNFNNLVPMKYDAAHYKDADGKIRLPGMNPGIELRPAQANGVYRAVVSGHGIFGYEVGVGKTMTMLGAAMELKRLGLAKKNVLAVPKSVLPGFAAEARLLYPGAKILTTEGSFDADKRKRTIARIATGDWDMVIMTHDHLGFLGVRPEREAAFVEEQIKELVAAVEEAKLSAKNDKGNRLVKELEKMREKLEFRFNEIVENKKRDDAVYFEDLGVDSLFVDEFHTFKSLPIYTQLRGIKGIPQATSDRAMDMLLKFRYVSEMTGGRNIFGATGTPVTNTVAEVYNLQRYFQPEVLKERGVEAFDAWAKTFGDFSHRVERTADGQYQPVTRFNQFSNLPELVQMTREMMDVVFASDVAEIKRPVRKEEVMRAEMAPEQSAFLQELQARAKAVRSGQVKPWEDNMLAIAGDARKSALDHRLVDPSFVPESATKIDQVVNNALALYREQPGKTQMIFSDLGVNPGKTSSFTAYQEIINRLVAGGIPRDKIINFSDLTDSQRRGAAARLQEGDAVIGIGGSTTMGTGVNAQRHLAALHHLDVPWLPAYLEQRDGRGVRQGNTNPNIKIYRYVTEGSFDSFMWQTVDAKSKFIRAFMKGDANARTIREADDETFSEAQIMAIASGNPRLLEKVQLDDDIAVLEQAERSFNKQRFAVRDALMRLKADIPRNEATAAKIEADAEYLKTQEKGGWTIGGKEFETADERGKALDAALTEVGYVNAETVAQYKGFDLSYDRINNRAYMTREGQRYEINLKLGEPSSTMASAMAVLRSLPKRAQDIRDKVAQMRKDQIRLEGQTGAEFKQRGELEEKRARLKQLVEEMKAEGKPVEAQPELEAPAASRGNRPRLADATPEQVIEHSVLIVKPPTGTRPARLYANDLAMAVLRQALNGIYGQDYGNARAFNATAAQLREVASALREMGAEVGGATETKLGELATVLQGATQQYGKQGAFSVVDASSLTSERLSGLSGLTEGQDFRSDVREEQFHWAQREVGGESVALTGKTWAERRLPARYRTELLKRGYPANDEILAAEAAAQIAAGNFEGLGLRTDAAIDAAFEWLGRYFERVAKVHGLEALDQFKHLPARAKEAREKGRDERQRKQAEQEAEARERAASAARAPTASRPSEGAGSARAGRTDQADSAGQRSGDVQANENRQSTGGATTVRGADETETDSDFEARGIPRENLKGQQRSLGAPFAPENRPDVAAGPQPTTQPSLLPKEPRAEAAGFEVGAQPIAQQSFEGMEPELEPMTALEIISTARKAGLLTGITTHLRNVLGNAAFQVAEEAARIPASIADLLASTATRQRTVTGPSAKALARSSYAAATDGVKKAVHILKTGVPDVQAMQLQTREMRTRSRVFNAYVNGVFRLLAAEDQVFRTFAMTRALEDRARAIALSELRAGKIERGEVKARAKALIAHPEPDLMAAAIFDSEVATFNNDNQLSTAIKHGRSHLPRSANFALDLVMPFDRTPTNILARVLEYSPLGFAKAGRDLYRLARSVSRGVFSTEDQRKFARTFGRATIGSGLVAMGWSLAAAGRMIGYEDDDNAQDFAKLKKLRQQGRSPLSIYVPATNTWHQIGGFSPLGNLLAIGATLYREGVTVEGTIGTAWDVVGSQPLLESLSDLKKNSKRPKDAAGQMVASFVPKVVKDVGTLIDPTPRKAKGFKETVQKAVPIWKDRLPAQPYEGRRSDVLDPTLTRTNRGPIKPEKRKALLAELQFKFEPKVDAELKRVGVEPAPPKPTDGESDAEYQKLLKAREAKIAAAVKRFDEDGQTEKVPTSIAKLVLKYELQTNQIERYEKLSADGQHTDRAKRIAVEQGIAEMEAQPTFQQMAPYQQEMARDKYRSTFNKYGFGAKTASISNEGRITPERLATVPTAEQLKDVQEGVFELWKKGKLKRAE